MDELKHKEVIITLNSNDMHHVSVSKWIIYHLDFNKHSCPTLIHSLV